MSDGGCSLTHASEKPESLGRVCREGVGKVALLLSEPWSTPYRDDKIAHEQKVGLTSAVEAPLPPPRALTSASKVYTIYH